jgi:ornithine carbamoyltransferase
MTRHFRTLTDVNAQEFNRILDLSAAVKKNPAAYRTKLAGKSIAVIFSKQSTRTRVSFEVGCYQLGAQPLILTQAGNAGMQMGRGETIHDTAQVMSRYVDCIVIRTFSQAEVDGLAEHGRVPVVNALTDESHPCQALADVLTMREHLGDLKGLKLVYAGAGNNVTHSLLQAGPRAGFDVVAACPQGLEPDPVILRKAQEEAKAAGTHVSMEHDLMNAAKGADVLYTDTWVSMGQDAQADALRSKLVGFSVTKQVMEAAKQKAIFMHCLPAHRGEEVTDEVIDGRWSVVFDEAENRLHTQKALLLLLLGAESWA